MTDGRRWEGLHRALEARGVAAPDRLELRLSCVIEEGAVFFNLFRPDPARRNWYAFEPVAAHHYEAVAGAVVIGMRRGRSLSSGVVY